MSAKKDPKKRDVTYETVNEMTRRGVASGLSVEQASRIARDSAERINHRRNDR